MALGSDTRALVVLLLAALGCDESNAPAGTPAPAVATTIAPTTTTPTPTTTTLPPEPKPAPKPALAPRAPELNRLVLEIIDSYEPAGGYAWPAPKGTHGVSRDLSLAGRRFARQSPSTHCSGLSFEIFWRALDRLPNGASGLGLDHSQVGRLMRLWYVPRAGGQGPAEALAAYSLGHRLGELGDARPGDFMQVWMNNRRGHTAVFLGWQRDPRGTITGVRYFSSQPETRGIGTVTRAIGSRARDIDRRQIYLARFAPK